MICHSQQDDITNLFNDIGAELLNRKSAHIPCELADNSIAEAIVVQVQNVLYDLVTEKRLKT